MIPFIKEKKNNLSLAKLLKIFNLVFVLDEILVNENLIKNNLYAERFNWNFLKCRDLFKKFEII